MSILRITRSRSTVNFTYARHNKVNHLENFLFNIPELTCSKLAFYGRYYVPYRATQCEITGEILLQSDEAFSGELAQRVF